MNMTSKDSYRQCLKTLYGLRRFGIKLGLDTIGNILQKLGNPQEQFACIHVAGTNGKGSVASSLASILQESGRRVGLYTSPHLVRFNERIRINRRQITDAGVVAAYRAVKAAHQAGREPTFFEFATAMAFYEFARRQVDWAVIETGMGGRLDATNIITPELSIITNISVEHREYLGGTLALIAREKAGIIKKGKPVISGVKQKKARAVIEETAAAASAPVYRLGRDFRARRRPAGGFTYYGIENGAGIFQTALLGGYQIDNAALALAAGELLNKKDAGISGLAFKNGLLHNHWPGRLEIVSRRPLIILDGAHNLAAAHNLADFLAANLAGRKLTLVVGILDDKPYRAMLKSLLPVCSRLILTRARIDRALDPQRLLAVARQKISDLTVIPDVAQAVRHAMRVTLPREAICIAGSLYVVGEAKAAIESGRINLPKRS